MKILSSLLLVCVWILSSSACGGSPKVKNSDADSRLNLPDGFSISVFAKDIKGAREMALGDQGTIFVGNKSNGNVYALRDNDGDHVAESVQIIAKNLKSPNGVAFRNGSLYVAEISRILRFDNIEANLNSPPKPVVVFDQFPTDRMHGWKYIDFGPDGKLYAPVGAPCNICHPKEEIFCTITRMDPDGTNLEIFAEGVRNSVGFDWHPKTGELWFTDNGRDWLGDNSPSDELNHAPDEGMHFGYPFCHQGDVSDPEFGEQRSCNEFSPPAQKLGPHVAGLGILFYSGKMFPESYQNRILIAQHGSWNRSKKIGYRVMMATLEGDKVVKYEPFITGWLKGERAWGRPVAFLQQPDGSVLLSDDEQGLIYRISYQK